jgi:hypothetical protein
MSEGKTQPHIAIFTQFYDSTPSRLEALVAYGIFTESEREGGFHTSKGYSDNIDRLFASNKGLCLNEARRALLEAANAAIEEKKVELAKAHKGFRCWGIWEAVLGAAIWSLFLIAIGFVVIYVKPDLIEVPKNVIEHQQPQR